MRTGKHRSILLLQDLIIEAEVNLSTMPLE